MRSKECRMLKLKMSSRMMRVSTMRWFLSGVSCGILVAGLSGCRPAVDVAAAAPVDQRVATLPTRPPALVDKPAVRTPAIKPELAAEGLTEPATEAVAEVNGLDGLLLAQAPKPVIVPVNKA